MKDNRIKDMETNGQEFVSLNDYFEYRDGQSQSKWKDLEGVRIFHSDYLGGVVSKVEENYFWIKFDHPEDGKELNIFSKKADLRKFTDVNIPNYFKDYVRHTREQKRLELERKEKDDDFLGLKELYSIEYSDTSHESMLYEILKKLLMGNTFTVKEAKWLLREKLYKVIAIFYEKKYSSKKDLHYAKNSFRFWFKSGDLTKSEKWANILLRETLKLDNELVDKIRRNFRTIKNNYDEYLASDRWKMTRIIALQRANGKCQVCESKENLNVHHRRYDIGNETVDDLTVLCRECHSMFHENKNKKARLFDDLKQD